MTTQQPFPLLLAEYYEAEPSTSRDKETAAELRRLHEVNEELLAREKRWSKLADVEVARCDKLQATNARLLAALIAASNYVDRLGGVSQRYRQVIAAAKGEA